MAAKPGQFTAGKDPIQKGNLAKERINCEKDLVCRWSSGGLIFAMAGVADWVHWRRKVLLQFRQTSLPVYYRGVQHDRGSTESLELHERKGSWRGPKHPRRTLVEETPGSG